MIIRALDTTHDWELGKGKQNFLRNQDAVAENIQTRLLSFLNDCFWDLKAGVDWFRFLGTPTTSQEIELSCRAIILASYGVVKVNSISVAVNGRNIIIRYNIDSIFTSQYTTSVEVPSV
jgi:hypothetical protein